MKKIVFIYFLILIAITTNAQTNYIIKGKNYTSVLINTKKNGNYKAQNFKLVNDSTVLFTKINSTFCENMKNTNVNYISVKKGNSSVKYGLYGAGLGLLISGISALSVISDPNYVDTGENVSGVIIGTTVVLGVVGAIIGLVAPKWEKLFIQPHSTAFNYVITPNIYSGYCGIHIVCKF